MNRSQSEPICVNDCKTVSGNSIQSKNVRRPCDALNSKMWASLFEGYDPGATKLDLELRHPFIDLRLVEYLLAIPAVPWCVNKHILRRGDEKPTTRRRTQSSKNCTRRRSCSSIGEAR